MSADFPFVTLKAAWDAGWSIYRISRTIDRSYGLVRGVLHDSGVNTGVRRPVRRFFGKRRTDKTRRRELYNRVRKHMRDTGERDHKLVAAAIGVEPVRVTRVIRYYTQRDLRRRA